MTMHLENAPEVTKRYIMLFDGLGYGDINDVMQMRNKYWPDSRIAEISYENNKPVKVDILDD